MEKKKSAKELLEQVRKAKKKEVHKNFDKIVGKPKNNAERRRVKFSD